MRLLALPLLIALSQGLMAQANFERIYGNTSPNTPISVIQTIDGNYLALLRDRDTTTVQDTSIIVLLKLDTNGDTIWVKTYQRPGLTFVTSLAEEANGTLAVAGHTDLGSQSIDVFLFRFDANGDSVSYTTYGTVDFELSYAMIHTSDGGYAMYGRNGTGAFWNTYLVKADSNGTMEWTKSYAINTFDFGFALDQTYDGGYILLSRGDMDNNTYYYDTYLIRTNAMGDTLWTQRFPTLGDDMVYSVLETPDSGFLLLTSNSTVGDSALRITKTDSNGNVLFTTKPGPFAGDRGFQMQLTNDGGAMIIGNTQNPTLNSQIMLLKVDNMGMPDWNTSYGGNSSELGASLGSCSDAGWIIMGSTLQNGDLDAYIIKVDSIGTVDCPGTVSFTSSAAAVCPNTAVNFSSTTVGTKAHKWLINGSQFSSSRDAAYFFDSAGSFQIQLVVCTDTASQTITAFDEAQIIYVTFLSDDSVRLNTDTPVAAITTFSWDFGDSSTTNTTDLAPTHTYSMSGFYTVTFSYTDANGCSDTLSKVIQIILVGTDELVSLGKDIKLWPNPMGQAALLQLPKGTYEVRFTDVLGKIRMYEPAAQYKLNLDRSQFDPGIYFYSVRSMDQLIKTGKLIVQ